MARVIQDVVTLLNQLIQTEYDTVDSRRSALAQVGGGIDRSRLGVVLADHRGHIDDLAVVVRNLGGEPLNQGDLRRLTFKGPQGPASSASGTKALDALRRCEESARDAYAEAASLPGIPMDVHAVLERLLADETRHLAWLGARQAGGSAV